MFQRFHAMKERKESGFTLIELLVVILIIAILAAIAIPVFLSQRKKGWVSQVESALKNAATAQESYATGTGGTYTSDVAVLKSEGLRYNTANVGMTAAGSTAGYCMTAAYFANATATTPEADTTRYYASAVGRPVAAVPTSTPACPAVPGAAG